MVVIGVLAAVPAAQADSPHFLKASASINSSGQLVCTFKEAGLGNTATVADISCSADSTAVYQRFNNGGNHPQAGNKETVGGPVSNGGPFPIRNGSATDSITVNPTGPGNFSCPGGQTLFLQSVTYTNIVLSGEGATADVPGTPATLTSTWSGVSWSGNADRPSFWWIWLLPCGVLRHLPSSGTVTTPAAPSTSDAYVH